MTVERHYELGCEHPGCNVVLIIKEEIADYDLERFGWSNVYAGHVNGGNRCPAHSPVLRCLPNLSEAVFQRLDRESEPEMSDEAEWVAYYRLHDLAFEKAVEYVRNLPDDVVAELKRVAARARER